MNRVFCLILDIVLTVSFACSCSKTEPSKDPYLSEDGCLVAPDNVIGIEFTGYPEEGAQIRMEDFTLHLNLLSKAYLVPTINGSSEREKYIQDKMKAVNERIKDESPSLYYGPVWVDCCIGPGASITSDCILFGKDAGSNLIEHFIIKDLNLEDRVICTYPDYTPVETFPNNKPIDYPLDKYLSSGYALPNFGMTICLKTLPEERPEQMTLTMRIPISYESWSHFSWMEPWQHSSAELKSDRTIEGSIKILLIK